MTYVVKTGLRALLHHTTLGTQLPYLCEDVRRLIWEAAHPHPYLQCSCCGVQLLWSCKDGVVRCDAQVASYQIAQGGGFCGLCMHRCPTDAQK